ncbi:MAG: PD-(D/E)XK nuclease family protein [Myxococcota bacterium]
MAQTYSHSRLSTFEDCPKRFEYRYVLKIPAETDGIEAFVGKRVHEVLERLYIAVGRGLMPGLPRVLARYQQLFDDSFDPQRIRIVREGVPVSFYRTIGERCLTDYYRRHYPFDDGETLGIEQHVSFSLDDDGKYKLQGIIDRIVRASDGTIEIHDYKTGRRLPNQQQLDTDRQLALYQIGLAEQYPGQPMRLVWHYLQQNQRPTSTRTPEQLATLRSDTMHLIDRIRTEFEYKPKRSGLCDWCEYNDRCPIYPDKGLGTRSGVSGSGAGTDTPPSPSKGQLSLFSSGPDHS